MPEALASPSTRALAIAYGAGRAFLNDIAHNAAPGTVDHDRNPSTAEVVKAADIDTETGNSIPLNIFGQAVTYDNELLDKHYVVGDGRGHAGAPWWLIWWFSRRRLETSSTEPR